MNPIDFSDVAPGQLIRIPDEQGAWAFVPDPLPLDIRMDPELSRLLSAADMAIGGLSEAIRQLPNPNLIVSTLVRSEALASSRMEGTVSSMEQLALFEAGSQQIQGDQATRETNNYIAALEVGIEQLKTVPPSRRLLKAVHGRLLKGVRDLIM